ncbi:MAG: type III pantothenate kinase [Kangiellaceae bacterium]|nr:type III pantothenate kinase [Kangiellaceae bacterium]
MILLMDMGNSRCKWALTHTDKATQWIEEGSWDNLQHDEHHWLEQFSQFSPYSIEQVLISSVASDKTKQQVCDWCNEVLGVRPHFAHSQERYHSQSDPQRVLINSYDKPLALGVDRWLVMIACFEKPEIIMSSSFAVLDAGTAITLDMVNNQGLHLGGHIVPGHNLMQKALLGKTGRIAWSASLDQREASEQQWLGHNTVQAVELGCLQASQAYIQVSVERMLDVYAIDRVYFTGGDGHQLMQLIEHKKAQSAQAHVLHFEDDLVLQGLYFWSLQK